MSDTSELAQPSKRSKLSPAWILAVLTLVVVLGPTLSGQRIFAGGDIVLAWPPWNQTMDATGTTRVPVGDTINSRFPRLNQSNDRIGNLDYPEWDELSIGGKEMNSTPNSGLFHPQNWLYMVLDPERAAGWVKLTEMLFATGGMWAFCRRLGLSTASGVFGGVVYAFSGFQVLWTNWPQTTVGATVPMVFWAVERFVQLRTARSAAPVAVSIALLLAGGFPSVAAYCLYGVSVYFMVRIMSEEWGSWFGKRRIDAQLAAASREEDGVARNQRTTPSTATSGSSLDSADVDSAARLDENSVSNTLFEAVRRPASSMVLFGLAILCGVAIMGFVLGSFINQLQSASLGYRLDRGMPPMALKALAMTAIPNAFGDPVSGRYYGPLNVVEAHMFIGTVPVFLAFFGAFKRNVKMPRGARTFFVGYLIVATLILFRDSVFLDFFGSLPGVKGSAIARFRSVYLFGLAVLAAFGFETMTFKPVKRLTASGAAVVAAGGAFLLAYGLAVQELLETANGEGARSEFVPSALVASVVLGVGVATYAATRMRLVPPALAVLVLSGAAFVQSGLFGWQIFPRVEPDRYVPETAAHSWLEQEQDLERSVLHFPVLFPGASGYYGLRTVTGRGWHSPSWSELLLAADPKAFRLSPTYSSLDLKNPAISTSPILDRFAARFIVLPIGTPPLGEQQELSPFVGSITLNNGESATASVKVDGMRAIGVRLNNAPIDTVAPFPQLTATIRTVEGEVFTTQRRIRAKTTDEIFFFPIADAETITSEHPIEIEFSLSDARQPIELAVDELGTPALSMVLPGPDGYEVVFADGVYAMVRPNALDRFRWVQNAQVEPDSDERLRLLAEGLDPDIVLLSAATELSGGGAGRVVSVDNTDSDYLYVTVEADGPGWFVVADKMQLVWKARVDGEPVPLLDADHAFVAIHLEPGVHQIELIHQPSLETPGRLVTLVGLAGLAMFVWGAALWGRMRGVAPQRRDPITDIL